MLKKSKKNRMKNSSRMSLKVAGKKPLKGLLSSTKNQMMDRHSLWMRERSRSVMKETLSLKKQRRQSRSGPSMNGLHRRRSTSDIYSVSFLINL